MYNSHLFVSKRQVDLIVLPQVSDLRYETMEEDLTCPVCLELYADPLMMPCSHSVCKACLHDVMKSRGKQGKDDLECPACRQSHKLTAEQVNKLPKNLALENIVFRYQEIRSCSMSNTGNMKTVNSAADSISLSAYSPVEDLDFVFEDGSDDCHCGMCDEAKKRHADWFCQQCQVLYCQQCLDVYHPKRGPLVKHKVRRPTLKETAEYLLRCPDHCNETASIFCDTCKVVACHLCVCQGQGQHCKHCILDLETARKQLQETVFQAKGELANVIESFSKKDCAIDSQIHFLKSLEESAKSSISSQYNCILADVAATLRLARNKSVKCILDIISQHSLHLTGNSQQIKALLAQCHSLDAACKHLLSGEKVKSKSHGSVSDEKSQPKDCVLSPGNSSRSNASFSSLEDVNEGKSTHEKFVKKSTFQKPDDSKRDASTEKQGGKSERQKHVEIRNARDLKLSNTDPNRQQDLKKRASSDSINYRLSFLSDDKEKSAVKRLSTGSLNPVLKVVEESQNDKLSTKSGATEQTEDFVRARKSVVDKTNSERKMSVSHPRSKNSIGTDDHLEVSDERDGWGEKSLSAFEDASLENFTDKMEDELLFRADEVGPVLQQVSTLTREFSVDNSADVGVPQLTVDETNILSCVSNFHTSSLALLSNLAEETPMDCPIITPAVRSVVSPAHSGQSGGTPSVKSRILLTWGFNSTTFTADPVEEKAQWSITISRNTSHIGDIKSGYLFGVGVSTKPLSSKEQIGMNSESHAIVCVGGHIAMCQDSQVSNITPLADLPLTVTISVARSKVGLIMAYKVVPSGSSTNVNGRRIIRLAADEFDAETNEKSLSEVKVYPVFTVSQRVKMQFPLTSDV